jgi:hypothetical protein
MLARAAEQPRPRMNENALKQRYIRSYPNPFEQMLRQHDSLGLSDDVSDSIAILNKNYSRTIDSILDAGGEVPSPPLARRTTSNEALRQG